jgi:hypothetical protein
MIEYVRTSTRNNDSTLFIVFKSGQHSLLLVFCRWREILEVNVKMKIKAGIILLHAVPENANLYDKINGRNSEWIYLDDCSWTKKVVFSRAVRGLLNSEDEGTAVFRNVGNFSPNDTEWLPRSLRS